MNHFAKGLMYEHNKDRNTSGNSINKRHSNFSNLDVVEIEDSGDDNESNQHDIADDHCTLQTAEFPYFTPTRENIRRAIAALNDDHADHFNKCMSRLISQYERAIQEEFEKASTSPLTCRKLARVISGLNDLIHTIARQLINTSEYKSRVCNIVAHYIACELCAAQQRAERNETIIQRISSALRLYVADAGAYNDNVLRTLMIIPRLFNRAAILTVLYSHLFPQWSTFNCPSSVIIQAELSDKIYVMNLIIFHNWLRLETDPIIKERIVDFADKYMRPTRTLITNVVYNDYVPKYPVRRGATRFILEHLNEWECINLRIASKLDNRLPQPTQVDLTSDDKDSTQPMLPPEYFKTPIEPPAPAPDPPDVLRNLVTNARKLEPSKRAELLFSGIDNSREIVELSDDEVEMFSLDFNVPANVDANPLHDASNTTPLMDDEYVPITRIYPTNLRTYERATSQKDAACAASTVNTEITTTTASASATAATYTVPRIVNSYSCRLNSIHMVTTTSQPLLVDQCVQTADGMSQLWSMSEDENPSTCVLYSDTMLPASQSLASPEVLYSTPLMRHNTHLRQQTSHSVRLACGTSTDSSEASLNKKQVTFSSQHLDSHKHKLSSSSNATSPTSIRPVIKPRRHLYNFSSTSTSLTPTSSDIRLQSLKWLGRKEHLQAGERMFVKHDTKYCDRNVTVMPVTPQQRLSAATSKQKAQTEGTQHARKRPKARASDAARSTAKQPTPTSAESIALTPISSHKSSNDSNSTADKTPNSSTASSKASKNQRQLQRVAPTPPASSHSSLTRKQRLPSTESITSIDMQQLEATAKTFRFDRRHFSLIDKQHISFYNSLIRAQRKQLQQRRQAQKTQEQQEQQQQNNSVEISKQTDQTARRIRLMRKQRNQLRRTNAKLRADAAHLNEQLEIIKSFVGELKEMPPPATIRMPIIRLKRFKLENTLKSSTKIGESMACEECKPPGQAAVQEAEQDPQSQLQQLSEKQSQSQSQPESENVKKRRRRFKRKPFVPKKNQSPKVRAIKSQAALDAVTVTEQLVEELPSNHTESPDLCIAAYVTLAANGECCDEAQPKDLTMLQVQDTIGKTTSALDIEVATSNVPVYLLNGESRDVPTPTSLRNDISPLPCELHVDKEQLRRLAIANYLELQRTEVAMTGSDKYCQRKRSETVDEFCVTLDESDSLGQQFKKQQSPQRRQTFSGYLEACAKQQKLGKDATPGYYPKNIEYSLPIRLSYVSPPTPTPPPSGRKKHSKERVRRSHRHLNC